MLPHKITSNKTLIMLVTTGVLLFAAACGGSQAATPEQSSPQAGTSVEEVAAAPPTPVEAVIELAVEDQSEAPSEPAAPASEPTPAPTDETPVEVEVAEAEPKESDPAPELAAEEAPTQIDVDPSVGSLAPDFVLTTLDGETISLADLRGKNVLINYWATWCPPCINELPALENVHNKYRDQGFIVVSINGIEQDNLGDVKETVSDFGLTYPVLLDENETFWDAYRILFLPTTIYINEQGVIRFIKFGEQSEAEFSSMVEQLLSDQL